MSSFRSLTVILILSSLALGGCGVTGQKSLDEEPNPAQSTTSVRTENQAVRHFVKTAREQFQKSQLNAAEETINRGLNLDSENPVLWHLLAKIRFLEEKYDASETLASRSINYTGENRELTNQNWRLVAYSRQRLGDHAGAQRALDNVVVEEEGWWFVFW